MGDEIRKALSEDDWSAIRKSQYFNKRDVEAIMDGIAKGAQRDGETFEQSYDRLIVESHEFQQLTEVHRLAPWEKK